VQERCRALGRELGRALPALPAEVAFLVVVAVLRAGEPAVAPADSEPLDDEGGVRAKLLPGASDPFRPAEDVLARVAEALARVMVRALVAAVAGEQVLKDLVGLPEGTQ
jgi:hypothetical protein